MQDTSTDAVVEIGRHEEQRQENVRPQDLKFVYDFSNNFLLFFLRVLIFFKTGFIFANISLQNLQPSIRSFWAGRAIQPRGGKTLPFRF
jgi:hypothetical protein